MASRRHLPRRRKDADSPVPVVAPRPGAKNAPTPKRSDARTARAQVTTSGSATAKRGSSAARGKTDTKTYREQMRATTTAQLPPRERTPERVIARRVVDSRLTAGPLLLVALVVEVIGGLITRDHAVERALEILLYAVIVVVAVDATLLIGKVKREISAQVGVPGERIRMYVVSRAMLPKAWRRPVPGV